MAKLYFILAVAANLAILAQAYTAKKPSEEESAVNRLTETNTRLTGECLYRLNGYFPQKTLMTSMAFPLSVSGQMACSSYGSTFLAFLQVLGLRSKKEIKTSFKSAYNIGDENVSINLKMRLYVDKSRKCTSEFGGNFKKVFGGEARYLDFGKPLEAARSINNWTSSQVCETNTRTISPDAICKSMGMMFLSILKVSVDLTVGDFVVECVKEIDFMVNEKLSVKMQALVGSGTVKYGKLGSIAEVFQIPFRKHSLLIVKPYKMSKGLSYALELLRDDRVFRNMLKGLKPKNLSLTFSSGIVSQTIDYATCFKRSSLLEIFIPCAGEFQNVFKNYNCVHVSNILQEIRLNIKSGNKKCRSGPHKCSNCADGTHIINHPAAFYVLCNKNSPVLGGVCFGK